MQAPLLAVPNISEGRQAPTIAAIGEAFTGAGATLLDIHADPDHYRSVYTLVGEPGRLAHELLAGVALALERVSLADGAASTPTSAPSTSRRSSTCASLTVARRLRGAPSPEGLGRTQQRVVAATPAEYAAIAGEFVGLDATYVRSLLAGLTDAVRDGQPFDWRPVIELCLWVLEQPTTGDERATHMDRDPPWGWARKQVASLLSQAFAEGGAEAPPPERERIWGLLSVLAEDPDPALAQEARDGAGIDPATLAINMTRGEAMHAAMRYVLWVFAAEQVYRFAAVMDFEPAVGVAEMTLDGADAQAKSVGDLGVGLPVHELFKDAALAGCERLSDLTQRVTLSAGVRWLRGR